MSPPSARIIRPPNPALHVPATGRDLRPSTRVAAPLTNAEHRTAPQIHPAAGKSQRRRGPPPTPALVELSWQGPVAVVGQCSFELAVIDAAERQRRQRVDVEPAGAEGLQRRWRLHGAVATAEAEQLVDVHRQGRRIGLDLTVPAGDQLYR